MANKEEQVILEKNQSSVMIKRNSKGTKEYEIKVYADSVEDATELAIQEAQKLDAILELEETERE